MKFCRRCERWKPSDEFHVDRIRKDGRHPYCARCQSAKAAKWCRENRKRANANARRYRRNNAERHAAHQRAYRQRYPEKERARALANQALTKGLIKKPRRCSRCKRPHPRLEKHHRDYSKPLEIIWVCPPCHAKEDSVASPREETSDH